MKTKIKNYIITFIKEIIPVTVGILIALLINNWNEDRKDTNYIKQVYATMDSELKESKTEISESIPVQKTLIDSLEFYSKNNKVNILEVVLKTKGITLPKIKMNAWKSVSNSKIDLISYEKVTSLSDIEEQKEILKDKTEYLMTYLYSNFYETDKNKKATLKMTLKDIIQTEETAHKLIEKFSMK